MEVGGDNRGEREKGFRNNYKGHMDKTKGEWKQGREIGMAGGGGNCRLLYLNNNKIIEKEIGVT